MWDFTHACISNMIFTSFINRSVMESMELVVAKFSRSTPKIWECGMVINTQDLGVLDGGQIYILHLKPQSFHECVFIEIVVILRVYLVGRWKSERIENRGMMEKWKDRKVFSFPYLCLVEMVEKWINWKLFDLVENKVCMNLPLYSS